MATAFSPGISFRKRLSISKNNIAKSIIKGTDIKESEDFERETINELRDTKTTFRSLNAATKSIWETLKFEEEQKSSNPNLDFVKTIYEAQDLKKEYKNKKRNLETAKYKLENLKVKEKPQEKIDEAKGQVDIAQTAYEAAKDEFEVRVGSLKFERNDIFKETIDKAIELINNLEPEWNDLEDHL